MLVASNIFWSGVSPASEIPFTTAKSVFEAPSAVAGKHHPVHLRAMVLVDSTEREGMSVKDATGSVYVDTADVKREKRIPPGSVVELEGVTNPGFFASIVRLTSFRVVGTGPLPPATRITLEQLLSGAYDSQWIEIAGISSLMEQHRLTAYDAAYLELVIRRQLPLATFDRDLINACKILALALI